MCVVSQIYLLRIAIDDQLPRLERLTASIVGGTVHGSAPYARALVLEQNLLDALKKYESVTRDALAAFAQDTSASGPVVAGNVKVALLQYLTDSLARLKTLQRSLRKFELACLTDAYVELSVVGTICRARGLSEILAAAADAVATARKEVYHNPSLGVRVRHARGHADRCACASARTRARKLQARVEEEVVAAPQSAATTNRCPATACLRSCASPRKRQVCMSLARQRPAVASRECRHLPAP